MGPFEAPRGWVEVSRASKACNSHARSYPKIVVVHRIGALARMGQVPRPSPRILESLWESLSFVAKDPLFGPTAIVPRYLLGVLRAIICRGRVLGSGQSGREGVAISVPWPVWKISSGPAGLDGNPLGTISENRGRSLIFITVSGNSSLMSAMRRASNQVGDEEWCSTAKIWNVAFESGNSTRQTPCENCLTANLDFDVRESSATQYLFYSMSQLEDPRWRVI